MFPHACTVHVTRIAKHRQPVIVGTEAVVEVARARDQRQVREAVLGDVCGVVPATGPTP